MARDFNGTTNRIDWSSVANLTGSAITISMWVYADAYAHTSWLFHAHNSTDNAIGLLFYIATDGTMFFYRNGSTALQRNSNSAIGTGAWVHLLVTHTGTFTDRTTITLYKNGTDDTQALSGANGVAPETAASGSWSLGGRIYDDARNFDGRIAEVGVWSRVLSSTEIAALAAGNVPATIPTNLVFYADLADSDLTNRVGGASGTADGTTAIVGPVMKEYGATSLTGRATVAATGTVAQASGTNHQGAAVPSGRATITATAQAGRRGATSISGRATLTATGTAGSNYLLDDIILEWQEILTTLSGRASVSASGKVTKNAAAIVVGDANLIGTGKVTKNASAVIVGDANLIGTGRLIRNAQATINARASVTATGATTGAVNHSAGATISANANLSATGRVIVLAQASISGRASVLAVGLVTANGASAIHAGATITATGLITAQAQARIVASASLIATASIDRGGQALLIARAALIATATHTVFTQSPLVLHVAGRDLTLHAPERSLIMTPGERP